MLAEMVGRKIEQPKLLKKPEYEKLSAYYNLDNGTGRIRGVFTQQNVAAAAWVPSDDDLATLRALTSGAQTP